MYRCLIRFRCNQANRIERSVARRRPLPSSGGLLLLTSDGYDALSCSSKATQFRCFSSTSIPSIKAVPGSKSPGKAKTEKLSAPSSKSSTKSSTSKSSTSKSSTKSAKNPKRNAKTSARRRKQLLRQRRRRLKKEDALWSPSALVRREPAAFEDLFDRLASQYPLAKLEDAVKRISKQSTSIILSSGEEDDSKLLITLYRLLHSTNPISGARLSILEFLLSDEGSQTRSSEEPRTDQQLQDHVDIFVTARERGLVNQLFWGQFDEKEASDMSRPERLLVLQSRMDLHNDKTVRQLEAEASLLVQDLHEILPGRDYRSVVGLFADYATSVDIGEEDSDDESTNEKTTKKLFAMKKLSGNLEKRALAHFHLIAPVLSHFFYMNESLTYGVVEKDKRVESCNSRWDQARSSLVDVLMGIQGKMLECVESNPDITITSSDPTVEAEEAAASVSELELKISSAVFQKAVKSDRRFHKPAHMKFEAVTLPEATTAEVAPPTVIFLDNLPIDMTQEEVMDLYSRCGEIETVEIFNQRLDLDPGPLNRQQLEARRKAKLKAASGRFRKWQRPRTPAYGMVTFADEKGHQKAMEDPLRIFGMIVRKHPIRSIDTTNMTRLYLENVPEGVSCVDFEYHLCQQLYPDLFLCLDAGQNNQAIVGSCEIKFPSFEIALESYQKLQELDIAQSETPGCTVNWLQTPRDAEKWWTRALGFD